MIHYTYRIDNLINGKYYIGKHSSESLDDNYMGSGSLIKSAIAKYGIEKIKKTILKTFSTSEEAFEHEAQVVTMAEVKDPMCYNIQPGGKGGQKRFTDEELKERLSEQQRKYQKEYYHRPDVKEQQREYMREYRQRPEVKERRKEYKKEYYQRNKEHRKEYDQRSEVKERRKEYYQRNKEHRRDCMGEYYRQNKERILERLKEYNQRPEVKERQKEYRRKKYEQKKKEANENNIIFL